MRPRPGLTCASLPAPILKSPGGALGIPADPKRRRAGGDRGEFEPAHGDRGCHCARSIPGLPEWTSSALRELRVQPQSPDLFAALVEPHAPGERS